MTVSYVGQGANTGTTVTIPTHQIGDLILIFAYRDASNTAPSTPAAGGTVPTWTLIGSDGANTNSTNFRYAVATATNTTSGTWTNATDLICLVYRGARVGASAGTGANNTTTVNYPALTLRRTDNTSWVVGVAGHKTATDMELAPSGMTNRSSTGSESAGHDTNGTVTTWASTNVTVNASSAYRSWVVELRDTSYDLPVDKGTYTLTGNNATLAKAIKLTADKGTYTLTGYSTTLKRAISATLDKGTYTLTGNDVTLTKAGGVQNYTLTVDKGTYTYTGNDPALLRALKLLPDAGSYAVIGNDATLLRTHRLTADAGAYVVTGYDPTLLRTRILSVDKGTYLLTGQSITTARTYQLRPDKGTYTYTGRPVILNGQAPNTRYILIT